MLEGRGFQMKLDQKGRGQSGQGPESHLIIPSLTVKVVTGGIYSEEEGDICIFKKVTVISMWMTWRRLNEC